MFCGMQVGMGTAGVERCQVLIGSPPVKRGNGKGRDSDFQEVPNVCRKALLG